MTSEEYAKYFYQKTLTLEKEIEDLQEEIEFLTKKNENFQQNIEYHIKDKERFANYYYEIKNNFDKQVEEAVAKKIKTKESTFKANETKLKKEIDYLKKRINALLVDIEAMRAS